MKYMARKGKMGLKSRVLGAKSGSSVKCVDAYHAMDIVLM